MTNEDLSTIEERARAATKGPWKEVGEIYVYAPIGMVSDRPLDEDEEWITRARGVGRGATRDEQVKNLKFIAAARQDIPALVAEIRRLRKKLAEKETP